MQLNFEAIVLSAVKYGENSGIACLLPENHGIYKGLVRGITGVRQRGLYQPGNVIEANWRARLAEHLGNLTAGLLHAGGVAVMDAPLKLAALSSICSVFEATLQERDPVPTIYQGFKSLIGQLGDDNPIWRQSYILLELELLAQLGFGLELSSCAASGVVDGLIYVSPKSGRAVCREAGLPYHNKLLKLPEFILDSINAPLIMIAGGINFGRASATIAQINDGMNLCGYFLDKYFFAPHNIKQPNARARFAAMLQKESILEPATKAL